MGCCCGCYVSPASCPWYSLAMPWTPLRHSLTRTSWSSASTSPSAMTMRKVSCIVTYLLILDLPWPVSLLPYPQHASQLPTPHSPSTLIINNTVTRTSPSTVIMSTEIMCRLSHAPVLDSLSSAPLQLNPHHHQHCHHKLTICHSLHHHYHHHFCFILHPTPSTTLAPHHHSPSKDYCILLFSCVVSCTVSSTNTTPWICKQPLSLKT